jgi:ABC-type transport system involved in multi-copper enzyme maturation permease subunit
MNGSLWMRQFAGILRLELRKSFLARRGWWIYLLALGPLILSVAHWMVQMGRPSTRHSLGEDSMVFAAMFQFYSLRLGIFFGCVGIFSNQFRGEMLEKTLHYYFLTPVRRELLVAGKFIAGWVAATILFVGSVAVSFLTLPRHFGPAFSDFLWSGPGLSQLGWYMTAAALACAGYGAVFVLCGLLFRNPLIPAVVVMIWEDLTPFLPDLLKKISVIYYLKVLCPVEVPVSGPLAIMVMVSEPTPAWLAVTGMLAVAALLLVYAGLAARRSEISYSE